MTLTTLFQRLSASAGPKAAFLQIADLFGLRVFMLATTTNWVMGATNVANPLAAGTTTWIVSQNNLTPRLADLSVVLDAEFP